MIVDQASDLGAPGRIRTCDTRFRNGVALGARASRLPGETLDHLPASRLIIPCMFRTLLASPSPHVARDRRTSDSSQAMLPAPPCRIVAA
jgi:hypothetical protein